ncbi:MAG: hemerythrin domain-containing protein [Sterolibacteriaceae bacterium]|nr:hemerythrin domain-containing protein [Sterolibacteriaceae bacterium]MBK9084892.1 hemerythrin domain-containing protein [Sterolibacteriaceae bacterium]
MVDSLIPVAPALDEPLEILSACHGRVLAQLQTLQRLLAHLPVHGPDAQARQAAGAVLRYFDTAAKHHHEDEEVDLLPALQAVVTPELQTDLADVRERILAEHAHMYGLWDALRPQLEAVRLGQQSSLDERLVSDMDAIYRQHIDYEEERLLPLARQLLDESKLRVLAQAMTGRRSPVGAARVSGEPGG